MMKFTYYGDLLGIAGLYRLDPANAYNKLNNFYNITFDTIGNWAKENQVSVMMFSDSLLVYGDIAEQALEKLLLVHKALIDNDILLRGALVKKKLEFDPRYTYDNFRKNLPKDDTLARAVGLSSTHKGARLLIEPELARDLLEEMPDWLTLDGYVRTLHPNVSVASTLRRICPTPDNRCYEALFFWTLPLNNDAYVNNRLMRDRLDEMRKMLRADISEHYKETVALLNRSETRQKYTEKSLAVPTRTGRYR